MGQVIKDLEAKKKADDTRVRSDNWTETEPKKGRGSPLLVQSLRFTRVKFEPAVRFFGGSGSTP